MSDSDGHLLIDIWQNFSERDTSFPVRQTPKREIHRLECDNRSGYYLKIFYRPLNPLSLLRIYYEFRQHTRLLSAKAPVPLLVGMLKDVRYKGRRSIVIVTQELQEATPLTKLVLTTPAARMRFIDELAAFMVMQYRAGFVHHDLHFGNILRNNAGSFFFVDTKYIAIKRTITPTTTLKNLVALYSSFYINQFLSDDDWRRFSIRFLTLFYGELPQDVTLSHLTDLTHRHHNRWIMRRTARAFKSNRDFVSIKNGIWRGVAQRNLVQHIEKHFEKIIVDAFIANPNFLKNSNSTTLIRKRFSHDDSEVVIKRFNVKRWWKPLKNMVRRSRAARSWWWGWYLQLYGIPTPEPLFFLEKRIFGLLGTCFYGMKYQPDAVSVMDYVNNNTLKHKRDFIRQCAAFVRRINSASVHHHDFQLKNILVWQVGERYQFSIIDLEALRWQRYSTRRKTLDYFYQLRKSYIKTINSDQISLYDIVFFFKQLTDTEYHQYRNTIKKLLKAQ